MNSAKPTDLGMWWPHPDAFRDLTVEDAEYGFDLSAPDDTECGAWLAYWNQSEEHKKVFNDAFIKLLTDRLDQLEIENGKDEDLTVGCSDHREQT